MSFSEVTYRNMGESLHMEAEMTERLSPKHSTTQVSTYKAGTLEHTAQPARAQQVEE